jgi:sec-independent protein translocase protein TatA
MPRKKGFGEGKQLTFSCQQAVAEASMSVCSSSFWSLIWRGKAVRLVCRNFWAAPARRPTWERNMLNNIGLPGLLLIAVVVLVLFGRGKISSLMGEVGKGITAFKKGVDDGKKEIEEGAAEAARDVTPEKDKDKA